MPTELIQKISVITTVQITLLTFGNLRGQIREWNDDQGKYSIQAELVERDGKHVVLRKKDEKQPIRVPLDRLSQKDLDWISTQESHPGFWVVHSKNLHSSSTKLLKIRERYCPNSRWITRKSDLPLKMKRQLVLTIDAPKIKTINKTLKAKKPGERTERNHRYTDVFAMIPYRLDLYLPGKSNPVCIARGAGYEKASNLVSTYSNLIESSAGNIRESGYALLKLKPATISNNAKEKAILDIFQHLLSAGTPRMDFGNPKSRNRKSPVLINRTLPRILLKGTMPNQTQSNYERPRLKPDELQPTAKGAKVAFELTNPLPVPVWIRINGPYFSGNQTVAVRHVHQDYRVLAGGSRKVSFDVLLDQSQLNRSALPHEDMYFQPAVFLELTQPKVTGTLPDSKESLACKKSVLPALVRYSLQLRSKRTNSSKSPTTEKETKVRSDGFESLLKQPADGVTFVLDRVPTDAPAGLLLGYGTLHSPASLNSTFQRSLSGDLPIDAPSPRTLALFAGGQIRVIPFSDVRELKRRNQNWLQQNQPEMADPIARSGQSYISPFAQTMGFGQSY